MHDHLDDDQPNVDLDNGIKQEMEGTHIERARAVFRLAPTLPPKPEGRQARPVARAMPPPS